MAKATPDGQSQNAEPATPASQGSIRSVVRIKSHELLRHMREVEIDHEGRIYRLRLTQQNKLILTA
jgi:hemin uptake protein HemP